jgi:hypothetical protein
MPHPSLTTLADVIITEEHWAITSKQDHEAPEEDQGKKVEGS